MALWQDTPYENKKDQNPFYLINYTSFGKAIKKCIINN